MTTKCPHGVGQPIGWCSECEPDKSAAILRLVQLAGLAAATVDKLRAERDEAQAEVRERTRSCVVLGERLDEARAGVATLTERLAETEADLGRVRKDVADRLMAWASTIGVRVGPMVGRFDVPGMMRDGLDTVLGGIPDDEEQP